MIACDPLFANRFKEMFAAQFERYTACAPLEIDDGLAWLLEFGLVAAYAITGSFTGGL